MSLDSLKLLESKIEKFVDQHERLRQQHEALQERFVLQEKQLAEAASQLKQYEKERGEIRARLEHLLSRIKELGLA